MAIHRITVRSGNGSPVAVLDTSFLVRNALYVPITVQDKTAKLTTGPSDLVTLYANTVSHLKSLNWLRTINGIETEEGQFSITGDKCFSWIPGDQVVHTYKRNIGSSDAPQYVYVEENRGGGMSMLNMCEACESCAATAQLRHLLEDLKIKLNTLKDKNLYTTVLVERRKETLYSMRLRDLPAACGVPNLSYTQGVDYSGRLLGQFATCVHMWNYIAAATLTDTVIELAPQDPTAILIRTKRAFPTCSASLVSASATIQCTVDVSRDSASTTNDDISVFVPPPVLEFRPYETPVVVQDTDWTLTNDANDATHKTLATTFQPATVAGTYMLSVYILPFRCVEVRDQQGNPVTLTAPQLTLQKPAAGTTTDADGKQYTSYTYTGTNAVITNVRKTTVTANDYNQSKVFPSKSDPAKHGWTVNVTWTVNGIIQPGTQQFQETFMIEPLSPRVPIAELFGNDGMFSQRTLYDVSPR